jgi:flagellar biosynthetic protein FlhB
MSDDSDKTEEPTDHKLRKAKQEGNVPRSEDLNGFIGIVFVLLFLTFAFQNR